MSGKFWQPGEYENLAALSDLIRSNQWRAGSARAVSRLTYEESGRQFALVEKVTHHEELQCLDGVYENDFADNIIRNTFMKQGSDQILWVVETEYKFKTLIMRIPGPIMKKNFMARTQKDME